MVYGTVFWISAPEKLAALPKKSRVEGIPANYHVSAHMP